MIVVAGDGYSVCVLGPYLADGKNYDASMLTHMMRTDSEGLNDWLAKEDVFVLNRGFRDSLSLLHDIGYQVHIPAYLAQSVKQHTTSNANDSKLVTKVRWVVPRIVALSDSIFLANVVPNSMLKYYRKYCTYRCRYL